MDSTVRDRRRAATRNRHKYNHRRYCSGTSRLVLIGLEYRVKCSAVACSFADYVGNVLSDGDHRYTDVSNYSFIPWVCSTSYSYAVRVPEPN